MERTQQGLWREIEAYQKKAEPHIREINNDELRVCGSHYGDNNSNPAVPTDPENHRLAWLRTFHANSTLSNPKFIIEARGQEWQPARALLLEEALNLAADNEELGSMLHRCASDYAIRRSQAVCSLRVKEGYEDEPEKDRPMTVSVDRLAFDEYACDVTARERSKGMWEGHRVSRNIEDVIHEAERDKSLGWNLKSLRALEKDLGHDRRKDEPLPYGVDRRDLVYWPMWERGYRVDPSKKARAGYFGTVHYVLDGKISNMDKLTEPIRKSEAWFGHRSGPYAVGGYLNVGDLPIPVSPLVASGPQAAWTNIVATAVMQAVANYKNNPAFTDSEALRLFKETPNGDPILLTSGVDVRAIAQTLESGGLPMQLVQAFQLAMDSLQRNTGLYETRQGNVSADATATAIIDAQQGFNATMQFAEHGFRDFVKQIGRKWAFWLDVSPNSKVRVGPLPPEWQAQFGGAFVTMKGGYPDGSEQSALDHDAMDLQISAFSGRQKNEATMSQDFMALTQLLTFLVTMGPMATAVDIDILLRLFSRSRGMREAERIIDRETFYKVAAAMMGNPQGSPPAPREQPKPQLQMSGARPVQSGGSSVQRTPPPKKSAPAGAR